MAQQNYSRNVPFNTYKLSNLISVDGNDAWTWTGRTLCGYISADNYENVIPLGGQLTIDAPTADLKGYWCLNKLNLSVYIDNAGPDSYVEIETGTHGYKDDDKNYRNCRPLTNSTLINKISAYNGDIVKFWYNSYISCIIHPGENHTISTIWFDIADSGNNPTEQGEVNQVVCPLTGHIAPYSSWPYALVSKTLSVYLAEGGIMHYQSNKNTLNPEHPGLND